MWLVLIFVLLTACTPATETAVSPQPSPESNDLPTDTVPPPVVTEEIVATAAATTVPDPTQVAAAPTATAVSEPEPTPEPVAEVSVISGRTEEGAFFLGDPNAPITHIDYSDFL